MQVRPINNYWQIVHHANALPLFERSPVVSGCHSCSSLEVSLHVLHFVELDGGGIDYMAGQVDVWFTCSCSSSRVSHWVACELP